MKLLAFGAVGLLVLAGCPARVSEAPPPKAAATASATPLHDPRSIPRPEEQGPEEQKVRTRPRAGEIVYYRTHPDSEKIDRYCGAFDRSYVVVPVDIPPGDRAVLIVALRALFQEVWDVAKERVERVDLVDGHAAIHLASMDGLGFASTSCGGNAFLGSILRTAFQFDSVDSLEIRLDRSCEEFGSFMQTGRCDIFRAPDVP